MVERIALTYPDDVFALDADEMIDGYNDGRKTNHVATIVAQPIGTAGATAWSMEAIAKAMTLNAFWLAS